MGLHRMKIMSQQEAIESILLSEPHHTVPEGLYFSD